MGIPVANLTSTSDYTTATYGSASVTQIVTLSKPSAVAVGDVLIALVNFQNQSTGASTITVPSPWALFGPTLTNDANRRTATTYGLVVTSANIGSLAASWTWTTSTSSGRATGEIFRVTGADVSNGLTSVNAGVSDFSAYISNFNTSPIPAYTRTADNCLVIAFGIANNTSSQVPPASWSVPGFTTGQNGAYLSTNTGGVSWSVQYIAVRDAATSGTEASVQQVMAPVPTGSQAWSIAVKGTSSTTTVSASGAGSATSSASGSASVARVSSGAGSATSTATGSSTQTIQVAGNASTTSSASAASSLELASAGTASATSVASGASLVTRTASGDASATATASADSTVGRASSGAAQAVSSASGSCSALTSGGGSASATSTASASCTVNRQASGTASATSTAAGASSLTIESSGDASASAAASAGASTGRESSGSVSADSTASADTWLEQYVTGAASAESSASGNFTIIAAIDRHDLSITVAIRPRGWRVTASSQRKWSAKRTE